MSSNPPSDLPNSLNIWEETDGGQSLTSACRKTASAGFACPLQEEKDKSVSLESEFTMVHQF
jgi:hypothetical protein